jgi:beta-xylosidase
VHQLQEGHRAIVGDHRPGEAQAISQYLGQQPRVGSVELAVTVRNTGSRDGHEVVQLYVADPVASVTRPVTQLGRICPGRSGGGESADVSFTVHTDRLSFTGRTMARIVEPGEATFRVGTAGTTFAGPVSVQLVGSTRMIQGERVMDTPAALGNAP